jgi:hypothetical protein
VGRILGIAVVMAILAAVAPGRFGHHEQKLDGPLRWQAPARTSTLAGATGDHILFGRVVNHSAHPIRLKAADVHVVDGDGHRLPTRAAFADGFVPDVMLNGFSGEMYGGDTANQVGTVIVLRTGAAAPVSASFTEGAGKTATAIEYGGGRLTLK